jgi:AcrR family transcriptional regulator
MEAVHRGRPRLEPDPRIQEAILEAALAIAQEDGLGALCVAQVLARTQLSTRAFYRHFDSKDKLVTAMFLETARVEMERLTAEMADQGPVGAVAAWIEGRLNLAFDHQSDTRDLTLDAYSQIFASPELFSPAFGAILRPLIEQIDRGTRLGLFADGDPVEEAMSIHGVVWTNVVRRWAKGDCDPSVVRKRALRFCLRGLGVADEVSAAYIHDKNPKKANVE